MERVGLPTPVPRSHQAIPGIRTGHRRESPLHPRRVLGGVYQTRLTPESGVGSGTQMEEMPSKLKVPTLSSWAAAAGLRCFLFWFISTTLRGLHPNR